MVPMAHLEGSPTVSGTVPRTAGAEQGSVRTSLCGSIPVLTQQDMALAQTPQTHTHTPSPCSPLVLSKGPCKGCPQLPNLPL